MWSLSSILSRRAPSPLASCLHLWCNAVGDRTPASRTWSGRSNHCAARGRSGGVGVSSGLWVSCSWVGRRAGRVQWVIISTARVRWMDLTRCPPETIHRDRIRCAPCPFHIWSLLTKTLHVKSFWACWHLLWGNYFIKSVFRLQRKKPALRTS